MPTVSADSAINIKINKCLWPAVCCFLKKVQHLEVPTLSTSMHLSLLHGHGIPGYLLAVIETREA